MKEYLALFDIDGTILNLKKGIARDIFADTFSKVFGVKILPENLPSFSGKTDLQILSDIADSIDLPFQQISERINSIWEILYRKFEKEVTNENIELLPGINDLLAELEKRNDYAIGLVTGNFKRNAYLKLKTVELSHKFNFGAFGCDNENRNILPKLALNRAVQMNKVSTSFESKKAIVIGDTFRDILCAKANGMTSIAVETGAETIENLRDYSPDFILKDLSDTEEFFRLLTNYFENYEKNCNSN